MSDIYAMGGRPLTALSIIAFPIETLSPRVMNKMLQGGIDKLREAGVAVSAATASRTRRSSSASPSPADRTRQDRHQRQAAARATS